VSLLDTLLFVSGAPSPALPFQSEMTPVFDLIGEIFKPFFGSRKREHSVAPTDLYAAPSHHSAAVVTAPQSYQPPCNCRRTFDILGKLNPSEPCNCDYKVEDDQELDCAEYFRRRSLKIILDQGNPKDCGVVDAVNGGYVPGENCHYVHETHFVTKYKTECSKTYSTQCQTTYATQCKTTTKTDCKTQYQEDCSLIESEECISVNRPKKETRCWTEYVDQCTEIPSYQPPSYQAPSYKAKQHCVKVPKEKCANEYKDNYLKECRNVPKQSCISTPVEICGEVPKQECKLVPKDTVCQDVPEKQCRKKAYQFPKSSTRRICDKKKPSYKDDHKKPVYKDDLSPNLTAPYASKRKDEEKVEIEKER